MASRFRSEVPDVITPDISQLYVVETPLACTDPGEQQYNDAASNVARSVADVLIRSLVIRVPYMQMLQVDDSYIPKDEMQHGVPQLSLSVPSPMDHAHLYDFGSSLFGMVNWNEVNAGSQSVAFRMRAIEPRLEALCGGMFTSASNIRQDGVRAITPQRVNGASLSSKTSGHVATAVAKAAQQDLTAMWAAMGMLDGFPVVEASTADV